MRYGEIDRERESKERTERHEREIEEEGREKMKKVGEEGDRLGTSDRARPMIDRPTVRYQ